MEQPQDQPQASAPPPQEGSQAPDKNVQNMALVAHLLGLVGFLGPLIFWVLKKDEDPMVEQQAKEALNFQITVAIAFFVAFILTFLVIGVFLIPLIAIGNLVFIILAVLSLNQGKPYQYPICLRLLK
jgi:uncharacterized Tic20 family protein